MKHYNFSDTRHSQNSLSLPVIWNRCNRVFCDLKKRDFHFIFFYSMITRLFLFLLRPGAVLQVILHSGLVFYYTLFQCILPEKRSHNVLNLMQSYKTMWRCSLFNRHFVVTHLRSLIAATSKLCEHQGPGELWIVIPKLFLYPAIYWVC